MKARTALLVAGAVVIAAACTVDGNAPPTIAGASNVSCLTALVITPPSATRHPGDTLQVQASSCSLDFDPTQIRWVSSDTNVARVDSLSGFVQVVARGTVSVIGAEVADRTVKGAMVLVVVP